MTDKELHTLNEILTNLETWSTWNKTFANEMIGICSKMRNLLADRKTEPTVDKDINVRSKTMRDCYNCKRYENDCECIECHYEPKTEPQTEEPPMDEYYKDHDEFYEPQERSSE